MEFIEFISTPTIITFIGAIIVAAGAFWSSFEAKKNKLKINFIKLITIPTIITFLGAIIVAAGALWSSYEAEKNKLKNEEDARKFQEDLKNKNEQLVFKSEELARKSDEIAKLNYEISKTLKENIRLSAELNNLNKEIVANVTGGDSFCYLFPEMTTGKINSLDFKLFNSAKYPVFDVSMRIWNTTLLDRIDFGKIYEKHFGYRSKQITIEEAYKMLEDTNYINKSSFVDKEILDLMSQSLIFDSFIGTIIPKLSSNIFDKSYLTYTIPKPIDPEKIFQQFDML